MGSRWAFGRRFVQLLMVWCLFLGVVIAVPPGVAQANPFGDPGYNPINPTRLLDTRPAFQTGQYASPWGSGVTRTLDITTMPEVPADAIAVVMNVTTVGPTAASFLSIYPTGDTPNTTATNNFTPTETIVNDLVIAKIGTNGQIEIFNNNGNVDLVIDVVGYHIATGGPGYNPINPTRLLDTRPAFQVGQFSSPWGPGMTRVLNITTMPEIPADASAVVMNVTTVNPTAGSFLSIYPTGNIPNTTAAHNFTPAEIVVNDLVIARIGTNGQINIRNNAGNVDLVIDVVGYHTSTGGPGYNPINPNRLLDTRPAFQVGQYASPWGPSMTRSLDITTLLEVPAQASAVVMNVTTVNPTAGSFLSIYPTGDTSNTTATNNFTPAEAIVNDLVIAKIGTNGQVEIRNNAGNVDLVIDVVGYHTATTGSISGTVTNASGNPVPDISVSVLLGGTGVAPVVETATDGSYTVTGLAPDTAYTVQFLDDQGNGYVSKCWNQLDPPCTNATPVAVVAGQITSGIDAELEQGGNIEGHVFDDTGTNPLGGMSVCATELTTQVRGCVVSNPSSGFYSFPGILVGTYKVEFFDQTNNAYIPECYQDNQLCTSPTVVVVTGGNTTSGIDATLEAGGTITGTILRSDNGLPLPGYSVCAEGAAGVPFCASATNNGTYSISGLPAGAYTVTFEDFQNPPQYVRECWQDSLECVNPTPVIVTQGQVTANIDATIDRGARIQGTVTNADGSVDLAGIDVCAEETTTGLTYCRVTSSTGFYIMRDLLAGTYKLTFEDNTGAGYQTECWQDDVGCTSPTLFTLVLGQQVFANPTLEQ